MFSTVGKGNLLLACCGRANFNVNLRVQLVFNVLRHQHNNERIVSGICCGYHSLANTRLKKDVRKLQKSISMSKMFCIGNYDLIGFDLDGTLLRYNLGEMTPLVYELLREFLLKRGYPAELANYKYEPDFMQKGLILDAERGNILKLSKDAVILKAFHGLNELSMQQVEAIYGAERKWEVSSQFFNNPLSTWNGPNSIKMRTLLDYFDLAASLIFAQAVDVVDKQQKLQCGANALSYTVWPDLQDGLIQIYTREHFSNGQSAYFKALRTNPDKYLLRTNEKVIEWLQQLRQSGKATFLLTGSNIDFANFTASYALGDNWQQLFDAVVCFAKKPGFFTAQRPFLRVKNLVEIANSELPLDANLPLHNGGRAAVYSQGNWLQLRQALAAKMSKNADSVRSLYVGDNLIQDVYSPVKHHDLEAVAICEELLAESGQNSYEFMDVVASHIWKSYFELNNEPTLWSKIISEYSQLCIPLVDCIADVQMPALHMFECDNQCGFYPHVPKV